MKGLLEDLESFSIADRIRLEITTDIKWKIADGDCDDLGHEYCPDTCAWGEMLGSRGGWQYETRATDEDIAELLHHCYVFEKPKVNRDEKLVGKGTQLVLASYKGETSLDKTLVVRFGMLYPF